MPPAVNHRPAIIFDIGGVLLDWNPHYLYDPIFEGDRQAAANFLDEIGFVEWNARQDAGRSFTQAVQELSARFPGYSDLIRAYDERWEESIGGAHWDTIAVLESLHRAGYPLFALSNWSAEKFPLVRSRYPFFDFFQDIILSGEVQVAKPDPRIFELCLQRIARKAEECIYIDDSIPNVSVAQSLGFAPIHYQSASQLSADLRNLSVLAE